MSVMRDGIMRGGIMRGGVMRGGIMRSQWGVWTPAQLFASGEQGGWVELRDVSTLYQDAAGTTPITGDGDPLGRATDKSPNNNSATQPVAAARPTYHTDGTYHWFTPDGVDDNLTLPIPDGAYTVLQGTMDGVLEYKINVTGGTGWNLYADPLYTPHDSVTGVLIAVGEIPQQARAYMEALGAESRFAGVTSLNRWFRGRTDITELAVGSWDTSAVTNVADFAFGCTNLTYLDVSGWDTSSLTSALSFVYGCSSLTSIDISNWDTSAVTTFQSFARFCSGLTTVILDGGTGNPFSDSPCTNYTFAFQSTNLTQQSIDNILTRIEAAGTSNGTFDQSGGSAPSATGQAAIDALRARGWTITVTGGY